jgi:hypothetical protein
MSCRGKPEFLIKILIILYQRPAFLKIELAV